MRNINVFYQYRVDDGKILEYDPIYAVSSYIAELEPSVLENVPKDTANLREELRTKYRAIEASKPSTASGGMSLSGVQRNAMMPYNPKFKFRPDKMKRPIASRY